MNLPFFRQQSAETRKAKLREKRGYALADLREVRAVTPGSFDAAEIAVKAAVGSLKRIETQAPAAFHRLSAARDAETQSYRSFQVDHGLHRPAYEPNVFSTVLVTAGAFLGEAAVTAGLMVADGQMDAVTGSVYGASIAGINIATGLATGFFPCRYLGYRADALLRKPRDWLIRTTAFIGLGVSLGGIGLLNFAAARTRATGSHKDIWNFETVSLAATFSDYYAISIAVIGGLGAGLAIYKGITGLSDSYPGYLQAKKAAQKNTQTAADDQCRHFENWADRVFNDASKLLEDAERTFEEAREESRDRTLEAADTVTAHNHEVENARDKDRRLFEVVAKREGYITRRPAEAEKAPFDDAGYDVLLIPETDPADFPQTETPDNGQATVLRAELESAYAAANGAVMDGYSAFLADSAPITPSKKGD